MSAQQTTVWELRCDGDGCDAVLADPEYGFTLVAESPDRIREIAEGQDSWSHDDAGTDLCPACTCARDGHERRLSHDGSYAYCDRCSETLLEATVAAPRAEFL